MTTNKKIVYMHFTNCPERKNTSAFVFLNCRNNFHIVIQYSLYDYKLICIGIVYIEHAIALLYTNM